MRSVSVIVEVGSKSHVAVFTSASVANFLITSLKAMFAFTVTPPSSIVLAESKAAAMYSPANSPA
ncbi:hypothetical protein [uncultured Wocania sp.]|uniref:hypothetical protein n=1 Tax=uncultured Wocania sp. TaxID=2834404 RepID=UPI0030F80FC7